MSIVKYASVSDNTSALILSTTDRDWETKRLIKLLERLLKKRELYDEDKLKLIKEQLKTAKNELAIIEEKTSKGFK